MTLNQTDGLSRSRVILSELNQRQLWGLTQADQERYLDQLKHNLTDTYSDQLLESILYNYHHDHLIVAKLRTGQDFDYNDWQEWMQNVRTALAHNGLDWSSQPASSREDLVQIALIGLLEALPSYGYRSRFKTWAYTVFLRSVQQHLRKFQASKRKGHTLSLDQATNDEQTIPQLADHITIDPADQMLVSSLQSLIYSILQKHPDQRLAAIFHLAEEADRTVTEIGRRFQLSPARISDLLKQARQLLQQDQKIHDWFDPDSAASE